MGHRRSVMPHPETWSGGRVKAVSYRTYLDNVQAKTGNSPEDFARLAAERGYLDPLAKATVVTDWLKSDLGLGHGHAMAIYAWLKGKRAE